MVFMIYKIRQITALIAVTVRVWLDKGDQFSYSLLISELLSHISVLSLVSLRLNFNSWTAQFSLNALLKNENT